MNKDKISRAIAAAAGLAAASGAFAQVDTVFTGTGADFRADSRTQFVAAAPVLDGNRLELDGTSPDSILLTHPVSVAGTYPSGGDPISVRMDVRLARLSDDFDPVFAITDGVNIVGGQVGDNPNGAARLVAGTRSGDLFMPIEQPLLFTDAGFVAPGEALDASIEVTMWPAQTEVRVSFLGGNEIQTTSVLLDPSSELSFMLIANSVFEPDERYGLDSIELLRTTTCLGDLSESDGTHLGDGMIDFGDFLAMLALAGTCPGATPGCKGDIADDFGIPGGDGQVSFGDFLLLLSMVGPCPS